MVALCLLQIGLMTKYFGSRKHDSCDTGVWYVTFRVLMVSGATHHELHRQDKKFSAGD